MRALMALVLALGVAQAAPVTEIQISYEPDTLDAGRADTLARDARSTLPSATLGDSRNARPFLHLAARNADATVVAAALSGMARGWSRTGKGGRPKVNGDYSKVVLTRLGDPDGRVVAAALKAARLLTGGEKPHAKTIAKVINLAEKGKPPARVAAIDSLVNVRAFQVARPMGGGDKAKVVAAITPALSAAEPYVVAAAVNRLARAAYPAIPKRDELAAAAKRLDGHRDPGVRGMALVLAARIATAAEKAELAARVREGLGDKSAFVRAAAAEAAGALGDRSMVHDLVTRLDDPGGAEHEVGGFQALDGSKGGVQLRIEDRRVDLAALRAIKDLSKGSLEYKRPAGAKRDAMRREAIAAAHAWYEKSKASLPKAAPPKAAPPKAANTGG